MNVRCGCVLSLGAVAVASLAATPAQAQSSGDWQYAEGPELCLAFRTFDAGANSIRLQLRSFGPGSAVETTIASAQVPNEPNSVRMVELGWDGKGFERNQLGVLGSIGGVPSVTLLTAHRPVASFLFYDDGAAAVSSLNPAAESMQLRVVGNAPRELAMGSLEEPLEHLRECEANLMEKWGWGRDYAQRVATPPQMRDPQLWFYAAIVYPAVQNLTRVSSILELRLKVDAEGKVAECVVQSSPGSSLFGSRNCTQLRKLGRFTPALDSQGHPVESYFQMSITFARFD